MNRMLSARQIRGGRALLGWSRRDLAIVSGVSQGTIKAIEQGATDARLSTLRKLAQTFIAHGVEFVATGPWSGVVIKTGKEDGQSRPPRDPSQSRSNASPENSEIIEEDLLSSEIEMADDSASTGPPAFQWLGTIFRGGRTRKA
jgi:transcriptional regulator with XRE-family HTH domain